MTNQTKKQEKRCTISLKVNIKQGMPEDSELYITGNLPELGNWDPAGVKLNQIGKNDWEIELHPELGNIIECKITRGCWKTQGVYNEGEVPPSNLVIRANKNREVSIQIIDWLDKQVIESDPVVGKVITHSEVPGASLKYKRTFQVWLPENYAKTSEPFAVLYMHDGQNLFEPAESFAGVDWKVDETISKMLHTNRIHNCIVVGIPNSPDRMQELNLFTDDGEKYADYIVNEVKPFIDAHYRTIKSPEFTGIMGSSMGGLMSFQMACKYPHIFGLSGCLSPAFPRTYGQIFELVKDKSVIPSSVKFYLDTGEFEPPIVETYFRMMKILKEHGLQEGHNLLGFYDENATHCEAAWAKRLHIPLEFMFGRC
jgi:predicted alpha/beta superfamily hydrolase